MSSLLVLVPIALVLLGVAIWAFVWAVDHEQFDDLESEGSRILFEDGPDEPASETDAPALDEDADPEEHV